MTAAPQHTPSQPGPEAGKNRRAGKAVLAGVVAVGLLAAGGGTFAKWSDEKAIASGDAVRTGVLKITGVSDTVWKDQHGTVELESFQMVPGDDLSFTTTADITAAGKNLRGTLELDLPAQVQAQVEQLEAAGYVTYDVTISNGDKVETGTYHVTPEDDRDRLTVVGHLKWIGEKTSRTDGQDIDPVDLTGTKLVLKQA